jgi:hypothetical protein
MMIIIFVLQGEIIYFYLDFIFQKIKKSKRTFLFLFLFLFFIFFILGTLRLFRWFHRFLVSDFQEEVIIHIIC